MSKETEESILAEDTPLKYVPYIALRGLSVFPGMVVSFEVEREPSVAAVEAAASGERELFLVAQKDVFEETPEQKDLYTVGTLCTIKQFARIANGMRVMVEGKRRAKLLSVRREEKAAPQAEVLPLSTPRAPTGPSTEALVRQAIELYGANLTAYGNSSPEVMLMLTLKHDAGFVADYIAQNARLRHEDKQRLLELFSQVKRLQEIIKLLGRENAVLDIERDINEKLQERLGNMQRENVLREQLHVIQEELDGGEDDTERYRDAILALQLSEETENKLLHEVDRLTKIPFGSPDGTVLRTYLDECLELPWHKLTKERVSLQATKKILDDDHFGLDKVKERILEFMAVRQLNGGKGGSILCLVGPPGTGKTSIAGSIARALNRKMARMSLGGVHDEAEIRGHRKTYVGAMPGRIMAAVKQAGTRNPLLLLDEIDKLGSDYRGDPASALLEALDPEQNAAFRDHYLEVPFDLSEVLFIMTANTTETIPRPLLDRMEIIELTSYTDEEKLQIAKQHLLAKQRKKHGLNARQLKVPDDTIREVIACYTKESGVRQLERSLASICRKTAMKLASGSEKSVTVSPGRLEEYLGVRRYSAERVAKEPKVGVVQGLAWTSVGGELLEAEAVSLEGSGKLELTGNLGDVMKESAKAALTYIRSRTEELGIDKDFYKNRDVHIHFPEGAVPKDGPSAGITVTVAAVSALSGRKVRQDVAMTGEITLSGRILPIGGLKEKTMAALRGGIGTVLIPEENRKDLEEIDQTVRGKLVFCPVSHADEALKLVLLPQEPTESANG